MTPKQKHNHITKLLALILPANLFLTNFAFAETYE